MNADKPSATPKYKLTSADRKKAKEASKTIQRWARQRAKELDEANQKRVLTPTPEYGWEDHARLKERARALEVALANAERQNAKLKVAIEALREKLGSRLENSVLGALSRTYPRMPKKIHQLVEDSYGTVSSETIRVHIRRLVERGLVKREEEGYVRCRD